MEFTLTVKFLSWTWTGVWGSAAHNIEIMKGAVTLLSLGLDFKLVW